MLRVSDAALFERPIVITNTAYRFMVLEQLAEIGLEADVAAGADAARFRAGDRGRCRLCADARRRRDRAGARRRSRGPRYRCLRRRLPAGSGRGRGRAHRDLRRSARACRPPNTAISARAKSIAGEVRAVAKFVEKPDPATAAGYIKAGYLWNSGNFMFRAAVLLDEYRNLDAASVQAVTDAVTRGRARSRLRHAGSRLRSVRRRRSRSTMR